MFSVVLVLVGSTTLSFRSMEVDVLDGCLLIALFDAAIGCYRL